MSETLSLFPEPSPSLHQWDAVLINSSAGKDSQAMLDWLVELAKLENYPLRKLIVVHADLGRMEWEGTKALAEEQARHYGLRFIVTRREQGDLLSHVRHRKRWPDNRNRYCTSDHKRGPISRVVTQLTREGYRRILNCMGMRAQESPARAKKIPFHREDRLCSRRREVWTWLPLFHWKTEEVWARIKQSGVRYHPAYDHGMTRLSCVFCIFAPRRALLIAGKHNPQLLADYVNTEQEIQHLFRKDQSLLEIQQTLATDIPPVTGQDEEWNM